MDSYHFVSTTYELRKDFVDLLVQIPLFLNSIDVADGGAEHFAKTVSILKERYHLQSLLAISAS